MIDKIKEIALEEIEHFVQSTYQSYFEDGFLWEEAKELIDKELTAYPDIDIEEILHGYLMEVIEEWVYNEFTDGMSQTIHAIIDEIVNLLFVKFIDQIKKV